MKRKIFRVIYSFLLACTTFSLFSCGGNFTSSSTSGASTTTTSSSAFLDAGSTKIQFHYSNFYSLTQPNLNACAGDVKNYFSSFTQDTSTLTPTTLGSAAKFIKNVSVDMTDANTALSSNLAQSCSVPGSTTAYPTSSCASFDYGAITGTSASLSGSLLIAGGMSGNNYYNFSRGPAGSACGTVSTDTIPNVCTAQVYSLAVETLPASAATNPASPLVPGLTSATNSISSFQRLAPTTADLPNAFAGSSVSFSQFLRTILLQGGSTTVSGNTATAIGLDSDETWLYSVQAQSWRKVNALLSNDASMMNSDQTIGSRTYTFSKNATARTNFGYLAVPRYSFERFSTARVSAAVTGETNPTIAATYGLMGFGLATSQLGAETYGFDKTDRIIVVGGTAGVDSNGLAVAAGDIKKWNPTFGPEYADFANKYWGGGTKITQSLDSSYIQILNWNDPSKFAFARSGFDNDYDSYVFQGVNQATGNLSSIIGGVFGFAMQYDTTYTNASNTGVFYPSIFGIGGGTPANVTTLTTRLQDTLFWAKRSGETLPVTLTRPDLIASQPTFEAYGGTGMDPLRWSRLTTIASTVTDLGNLSGITNYSWYGQTAVKGFRLLQNDYVLVGGSSCRDYISTNGVAANCPNTSEGVVAANPPAKPRYVEMGDHQLGFNSMVVQKDPTETGSFPTDITAGASANRAGMAVARGFDAEGVPIIVAFGGVTTPGVGADQSVFIGYPYDLPASGASGIHWTRQTVAAPNPASVVNGSLVFSHVTGKFYLFGGLAINTSGVSTLSQETWSLSVDLNNGGVTPTVSVAAIAPTLVWSKLTDNGLTCQPNCPSSRRGHQMVEANYYNWDTTKEYFDECAPNQPCSMAIFMEGGTNDGVSALGDRWTFDPTANNGRGHWQRIGEFPARRFASSATITFTPKNSSQSITKALLFGGEFGLQNPRQASFNSTGNIRSFVAPILGDTLLFDFAANTWSRVKLLGQGVRAWAGPSYTSSSVNQFQERQYFYGGNAGVTLNAYQQMLMDLTPPPLAGSFMVTRTLQKRTVGNTVVNTPLSLPEVFLLGGRKKDGSFNSLKQVWKFCMGSPGETPDTGTPSHGICDSYDPSTNVYSAAPSQDNLGRWLKRDFDFHASFAALLPDTTERFASYMGSGTYDSNQDRIITYGGLRPSTAHTLAYSPKITDTNQAPSYISALGGPDDASPGAVYEYEFPTQSIQSDTAGVPGGGTEKAYMGQWNLIPSCSTTTAGTDYPMGRYGHSVSFDAVNRQLVVIGGFCAPGSVNQTCTAHTPLTQSWVSNGSTTSSTVPEIWTAKKTGACYTWKKLTTFANTFDSSGSSYPAGGLAHATAFYLPSQGYNSGYYSSFDAACSHAGPLANADFLINRQLAGGAYIDIDRGQLSSTENLLLNLTYIPLGPENTKPGSTLYNQSEATFFKIHLMRTNETLSFLQSKIQPRFATYENDQTYPKIVHTLSVISAPTGQAKTDQFLLPINVDASIDRIRIERQWGSGILIDATITRLGTK